MNRPMPHDDDDPSGASVVYALAACVLGVAILTGVVVTIIIVAHTAH